MSIKKKENNNIHSLDINKNFPRVSLIIPHELKMKNKKALFNLLMKRADIAERELRSDFPEEEIAPVINKLKKVIKTVQCPPEGKNIAIFVSPLAKKVYYFTPSCLENYKLPVLVNEHQP